MSVITISRQFGAEGKTLGRRLADTLGYYYADEDIIERAVVEVYLSSDGKKIFEAEPGDKMKRFISRLNPFGTSLMELPLSDKERHIDGFKYVELLNLIIPKIATDGNAVIVAEGDNLFYMILMIPTIYSLSLKKKIGLNSLRMITAFQRQELFRF
jgi:hypothetical protein